MEIGGKSPGPIIILSDDTQLNEESSVALVALSGQVVLPLVTVTDWLLWVTVGFTLTVTVMVTFLSHDGEKSEENLVRLVLLSSLSLEFLRLRNAVPIETL